MRAASAQAQTRKSPGAGKAAAKRLDVAFAIEREAAALAFVQANHPDLVGVLKSLSEMARDRYESAIVEIFRQSEALTELRDRDPERHALQLAAWQLKSRIDLTAVRLAKSADEKLRLELRELLKKQVANQTAILRLDCERQRGRLKKLEAELQRVEANAAATVESRFERLSKVRPSKQRPVKKKLETETGTSG